MSMRCKRIACTLSVMLVIFTLCLSAAAAGIPSPSDDFYVLDQAAVLTDSTKKHIVEENDLLYYHTGAQIVVVTVGSTDGTPIRDYASSIFKEWKIGSNDKNNGLLVLLAIDDDDYWVVQGRGLESGLTSGDIKVLLDDYLEMNFRDKKYDEGVLTLFDALTDKLDSIYKVGLETATLPADANTVTAKADGSIVASVLRTFVLIIAIVIFIVIVIVVVRGTSVPRYIRRSARRRTPPPRPIGGYGAPVRRTPPPRRPTGPRPGAPRPNAGRPVSPRPGAARPAGPRPTGPRPMSRPSQNRPMGGVGRSSGSMPRSGGGGTTRGGGAGRR